MLQQNLDMKEHQLSKYATYTSGIREECERDIEKYRQEMIEKLEVKERENQRY
jgi:hypothetical protein